jgi:hypothetical protein
MKSKRNLKNKIMELEKFEQAKKIKGDLDRLETQKYKLESALKSCGLGVTIGYSRGGSFPSKQEVSLYNRDLIKEMITKALEGLNGEIDLVKEEFEKL